MSVELVVVGLVVCAVSGVPGLFFGRAQSAGQWFTTLIGVAGCVLGLSGVGAYWCGFDNSEVRRHWQSIPGAEFRVGLDGLSVLFLVPIFLIALLGSVYGLSYWKQTEHPGNARKLRLFYGLLPAGMALLVIARNSLVFLAGWEIMALSAFFLVTTEENDKEVCVAGWIYLVATHCSTLLLFALFGLLYRLSGDTFDLDRLSEEKVTTTATNALYLLALLGFGIKAGLMPLHVWLPGAHAMAPSHVSAMMSGVLIKMGVYGFLRVTSLVPAPTVEWGGILLAVGAVSGVLGVAYALGQRDLKRLLAYSSIENIGIIFMGIGLAVLGRSMNRPEWIVLGLCGAVLHVWNHAFFKSMLFFAAGSIIHATHTREIDKLGGLFKTMPKTAFCFLIGALAVCGLPPLNGFVSEFLIYVGLFQTVGTPADSGHVLASLAAPVLALIGAMAVACFVNVFGAVFLGSPRTDHAAHAHESAGTMVGPMFILVGCCVVVGLAPVLLSPVLMDAARTWAPELTQPNAPHLAGVGHLDTLSVMAMSLVAAILLASLVFWYLLRNSPVDSGPTWGCGYAAPTPRLQYTSSSFTEMVVGIFSWVLRTRTKHPERLALFPQATSFKSETPDVVLDEGILPTFRVTAWVFSWLRVFQQGSIQAYLLYIFLTLLFILLWR